MVRTGYGKYRQIPIQSGENKLYNVLLVYSIANPKIGYTQGMNFLAAQILEVVEDEFLAF